MAVNIITVDVANNQLAIKIRDEYCEAFNYEDSLPTGVSNPENKTQFARRMMLEQLKAPIVNLRQRKRDTANPIVNPELS